jgi:hypothetical protein
MGRLVNLTRVGLFLHGESSQNPRRVSFEAAVDASGAFVHLATMDLEQRCGDHMAPDLPVPVPARYVRYSIADNYGGSGAFTSKLFLFGTPAEA